jgi:hypothetical protein
MAQCVDCPRLDSKWAAENGITQRNHCCSVVREEDLEPGRVFRYTVPGMAGNNRAERRRLDRQRRRACRS